MIEDLVGQLDAAHARLGDGNRVHDAPDGGDQRDHRQADEEAAPFGHEVVGAPAGARAPRLRQRVQHAAMPMAAVETITTSDGAR